MLVLILTLQLYMGGPVAKVEVKSCEPIMTQWLNAAEAWAARNHLTFTGAATCGPEYVWSPK